MRKFLVHALATNDHNTYAVQVI